MQNPVASPGRTHDVPTPHNPRRVCPWWIGYLLASPIRRIFNPPAKVLESHVKA